MKLLLARLFVISPFWVAYNFHETYDGPMHEQMSFSTMLIMSGVFYAILAWKDSDRAPRSSVSVIIRNMGLTFCCVFFPLKLLGMGWFLWYMMAHSMVWIALFWQWVAHTIAHHFVYPFADPNYHSLRKAGWHPYWDGSSFNYDSELIKDGGFEKPEYTGFIPPAHYRFQCPRCLARVEHSFGVCWNCSYGSCPGDEKEYYERWPSQ